MRANLICEICLLDASGLHFGVASCRACAAFFRRSVVLKLVYKCQKERDCDVTKKQRFSCRCCRFQKCLDRGMRPSMVQPNPDKPETSQGTNLLSEVSTPPSSGSHHHGEVSPSVSGTTESKSSNGSSTISQFEKMALYEKQKALKIRVNSLFESSAPLTNFILPIKLSLTQQALVALNEHLQKWPLCTPENIRTGVDLKIEELCAYINTEIENIAIFCMSIDDFAHLEKEQKWIVFKKFWNNFCCLERYKATVRCFGRPSINTWISYGGEVYDFQNYSEWGGKQQPEMKKMMEFLLPSCMKEMALLGNQLLRMEPTDFELVFCMLQSMWNLKRDPGISEGTLAVADDVKKRLAQEVHDYYTIQMKRQNYAARLMQMMNIIASMDEIDQQRKEDRTVCRTFDLCKDDIFYTDFTE